MRESMGSRESHGVPAFRPDEGQTFRIPTVSRFSEQEIKLHNFIVISFLLLLASGALVMLFKYAGYEGALRPGVVMTHKAAGVVSFAGAILMIVFGDKAVWADNVRAALRFTRQDAEWLIKKPLSIFINDLELPPSGRFNAGQKIWLVAASAGLVTLAASGLALLIYSASILALFIHTLVSALLVAPLAGHVCMAFTAGNAWEWFETRSAGLEEAGEEA